MNRIQRLAAQVAELRAARQGAQAAKVIAAELREIGCNATAWENGEGVTVDDWNGTAELDAARDAKLAELERRGFSRLVVIIDRITDCEGETDPTTHGRNDA